MISDQQQNCIRQIFTKHRPIFIGLFGSYARNEQTAESDLDLLVDFDHTVDLLTLIGIEQELTEGLSIKVDLVTKRAVNRNLMPFILRDLIPIVG